MSPRPKIAANDSRQPMAKTENWQRFVGQTVNSTFRLEQYLGESAQGAVFLAENKSQTPSRVAIKLVAAKPASANRQLKRWQQAAKFSHPRLLRLMESGRCEIDGIALLFLVMEHAEENLAQILPQRALTPEETKEFLLPLLETLAFLHNAGFVHGHLSPANILVVNDQLKFSSDGIVKINELSGQTKHGPYDSPEAASMTTSPAGDVWALGMVIAEALTQQLPRTEASPAGDDKAVDPEIPASLPEPFQEIARNCLRADPQRRWSVARILAHLQAASNTSVEAVAPRPEPSAKRGFLILLAAAAVIAVVAGIVMRDSHSTPAQNPPMQEAPVAASSQPMSSPASSAIPPQPAPPQSAKPQVPPVVAQQHAESPKPGSPKPTRAKRELKSQAVSPSATGESGDSAAGVVRRVVPTVPASARNTIHGKVRVRVRVAVDTSGRVTGVSFITHGPSDYFARLAETAAQQWQFVPAQANGQNTASAWVIKFAFGRKVTEAYPTRAE